jgi:hypothetical protein
MNGTSKISHRKYGTEDYQCNADARKLIVDPTHQAKPRYRAVSVTNLQAMICLLSCDSVSTPESCCQKTKALLASRNWTSAVDRKGGKV